MKHVDLQRKKILGSNLGDKFYAMDGVRIHGLRWKIFPVNAS
jgi:hypothetical protein